MKVYQFEHDGFFLGGVSICIAENEHQARVLLEEKLKPIGLAVGMGTATIVNVLDVDKPQAVVMFDGDY